MIADCVRRLGALMIGLALVAGPVAHAGAMANMNVDMSAAGMSDMAMPEGCDICDGDTGVMSASACFANCVVPSAILPSQSSLADTTALFVVAQADTATTDRHRPPDLHPPRPIVTG